MKLHENSSRVTASFLGIDLAWSDRNPSGLARVSFDGGRAVLAATDYLTSDQAILRWVEDHTTQITWLGIDAPIIAPNPPETSRAADKVVGSLFGRYHVGVYPGNRQRCARPIGLSRKLAALGFSPDPFLLSRAGKRQLEIFPHLAQIALFGQKRIIKYKKGSRMEKCRGLRTFQLAVGRKLSRRVPPMGSDESARKLIRQDPKTLKGGKLKELEDRLDAVLCAYMTLYFWFWGQRKCVVYGDLQGGYIIGPRC